MPAVGAFVQECARLGGGGPQDVTREPAEPLSALDILAAVVEPDMADAVSSASTVSLAGSFPCVQSIRTSHGDTTVHMSVIATQTAVATAKNALPAEVQNISDTNVFKSPLPVDFEMNEASSRVCAVCRRTDSDLRSRGEKGLQQCVCKAVGLRYW